MKYVTNCRTFVGFVISVLAGRNVNSFSATTIRTANPSSSTFTGEKLIYGTRIRSFGAIEASQTLASSTTGTNSLSMVAADVGYGQKAKRTREVSCVHTSKRKVITDFKNILY